MKKSPYVDVKIRWNGAIWAQGGKTLWLEEGTRNNVRLMRYDSPYNPSELLEADLTILPDPDETTKLREENKRLRELVSILGLQ